MIHYLRTAKRGSLEGTVLLRLDFNTEDDWRMRAVIPTIKFLLKNSSKIVIASHRGRPARPKFEKKLSLQKDAKTLSKLLGKRVVFIPHFKFAEIKKKIEKSPRGNIFLLENLRFLKGETENDPKFAKTLALLADVYVNDAFAVSHRANASIAAITKYLPSYAGFEIEKEIKFLSEAMIRPRRPLALVLGGAKAEDKLGVITYFKNKADWFLLGGGAANTVLYIKGINVGRSLRDTKPADLKKFATIARSPKMALPSDVVWEDQAILDIGPESIKDFSRKIFTARTIIWTGPLGLIEKSDFAKGTTEIARAIVKNKKAFSIAGGGETVMFLKKHGLDKKFSFISTGGGAMIDFLAGKKLPGIKALE